MSISSQYLTYSSSPQLPEEVQRQIVQMESDGDEFDKPNHSFGANQEIPRTPLFRIKAKQIKTQLLEMAMRGSSVSEISQVANRLFKSFSAEKEAFSASKASFNESFRKNEMTSEQVKNAIEESTLNCFTQLNSSGLQQLASQLTHRENPSNPSLATAKKAYLSFNKRFAGKTAEKTPTKVEDSAHTAINAGASAVADAAISAAVHRFHLPKAFAAQAAYQSVKNADDEPVDICANGISHAAVDMVAEEAIAGIVESGAHAIPEAVAQEALYVGAEASAARVLHIPKAVGVLLAVQLAKVAAHAVESQLPKNWGESLYPNGATYGFDGMPPPVAGEVHCLMKAIALPGDVLDEVAHHAAGMIAHGARAIGITDTRIKALGDAIIDNANAVAREELNAHNKILIGEKNPCQGAE